VEVFGGEQRREFLYVEDAARGMLAVAEKGERGEAYNLGTYGDTQVSIRELALLVSDLTGFKGSINFVEDVPTGDRSRSTDAAKVHRLGWEHQVGLEEGLRRTIEWWNEHRQ